MSAGGFDSAEAYFIAPSSLSDPLVVGGYVGVDAGGVEEGAADAETNQPRLDEGVVWGGANERATTVSLRANSQTFD